jgi:hypothetical protein
VKRVKKISSKYIQLIILELNLSRSEKRLEATESKIKHYQNLSDEIADKQRHNSQCKTVNTACYKTEQHKFEEKFLDGIMNENTDIMK